MRQYRNKLRSAIHHATGFVLLQVSYTVKRNKHLPSATQKVLSNVLPDGALL